VCGSRKEGGRRLLKRDGIMCSWSNAYITMPHTAWSFVGLAMKWRWVGRGHGGERRRLNVVLKARTTHTHDRSCHTHDRGYRKHTQTNQLKHTHAHAHVHMQEPCLIQTVTQTCRIRRARAACRWTRRWWRRQLRNGKIYCRLHGSMRIDQCFIYMYEYPYMRKHV